MVAESAKVPGPDASRSGRDDADIVTARQTMAASALLYDLRERAPSGPRGRSRLSCGLRRVTEGDDRPDERRGGQTQERRDPGSIRVDRPADRGTETERTRGDEYPLRYPSFVVGIPLEILAAHGDRDRHRGPGDMFGMRGELGQPNKLGSVADDDERPRLAVDRAARPARYFEDRLKIGFRDGLRRELADLTRLAQGAKDRAGSGASGRTRVAHDDSLGRGAPSALRGTPN